MSKTAAFRQTDDGHGITEEMIHDLVHAFYGNVRKHQDLGPIFERVIGEGWDAHLAKMCDFWSSIVLTTGRYKGAPMLAHMRLKMVRPAHFAQWLDLFSATAFCLFPPETAAVFIARAEKIARSLELGMFFDARSRDGSRHIPAAQDNQQTQKGSLS